MDFYKPSWVDLAIVAVLILGMVRGRKRGMSEELLDVLKWLLIVVAGAYLHKPLGSGLASLTPFSLLGCYVTVYGLIIAFIFGLFSMFKRAAGSKLLESDFFGGGEYYLGMMAGCFRYACVLVVVLSFLNARYYSPKEIAAKRKTQMDNFGMILFSMSEIQAEVFQRSLLGSTTRNHLSAIMITPTAPENKGLGRHRRGVQARERRVQDILD